MTSTANSSTSVASVTTPTAQQAIISHTQEFANKFYGDYAQATNLVNDLLSQLLDIETTNRVFIADPKVALKTFIFILYSYLSRQFDNYSNYPSSMVKNYRVFSDLFPFLYAYCTKDNFLTKSESELYEALKNNLEAAKKKRRDTVELKDLKADLTTSGSLFLDEKNRPPTTKIEFMGFWPPFKLMIETFVKKGKVTITKPIEPTRQKIAVERLEAIASDLLQAHSSNITEEVFKAFLQGETKQAALISSANSVPSSTSSTTTQSVAPITTGSAPVVSSLSANSSSTASSSINLNQISGAVSAPANITGSLNQVPHTDADSKGVAINIAEEPLPAPVVDSNGNLVVVMNELEEKVFIPTSQLSLVVSGENGSSVGVGYNFVVDSTTFKLTKDQDTRTFPRTEISKLIAPYISSIHDQKTPIITGQTGTLVPLSTSSSLSSSSFNVNPIQGIANGQLGEIGQLQAMQKDAKNSIDGLWAVVQGVNAKIAALETKTTDTDEKMSSTVNGIVLQNPQLAAIKKQAQDDMNGLHSLMQGIEKRIALLEAKSSTIDPNDLESLERKITPNILSQVQRILQEQEQKLCLKDNNKKGERWLHDKLLDSDDFRYKQKTIFLARAFAFFALTALGFSAVGLVGGTLGVAFASLIPPFDFIPNFKDIGGKESVQHGVWQLVESLDASYPVLRELVISMRFWGIPAATSGAGFILGTALATLNLYQQYKVFTEEEQIKVNELIRYGFASIVAKIISRGDQNPPTDIASLKALRAPKDDNNVETTGEFMYSIINSAIPHRSDSSRANAILGALAEMLYGIADGANGQHIKNEIEGFWNLSHVKDPLSLIPPNINFNVVEDSTPKDEEKLGAGIANTILNYVSAEIAKCQPEICATFLDELLARNCNNQGSVEHNRTADKYILFAFLNKYFQHLTQKDFNEVVSHLEIATRNRLIEILASVTQEEANLHIVFNLNGIQRYNLVTQLLYDTLKSYLKTSENLCYDVNPLTFLSRNAVMPRVGSPLYILTNVSYILNQVAHYKFYNFDQTDRPNAYLKAIFKSILADAANINDMEDYASQILASISYNYAIPRNYYSTLYDAVEAVWNDKYRMSRELDTVVVHIRDKAKNFSGVIDATRRSIIDNQFMTDAERHNRRLAEVILEVDVDRFSITTESKGEMRPLLPSNRNQSMAAASSVNFGSIIPKATHAPSFGALDNATRSVVNTDTSYAHGSTRLSAPTTTDSSGSFSSCASSSSGAMYQNPVASLPNTETLPSVGSSVSSSTITSRASSGGGQTTTMAQAAITTASAFATTTTMPSQYAPLNSASNVLYSESSATGQKNFVATPSVATTANSLASFATTATTHGFFSSSSSFNSVMSSTPRANLPRDEELDPKTFEEAQKFFAAMTNVPSAPSSSSLLATEMTRGVLSSGSSSNSTSTYRANLLMDEKSDPRVLEEAQTSTVTNVSSAPSSSSSSYASEESSSQGNNDDDMLLNALMNSSGN